MIIYLGLSGGLDSVCLLDMLRRENKNKIVTIHINHGLQSNAETMAKFCEKLCYQLDIEFIYHRLSDLKLVTTNQEQAYRTARYEAFCQIVPAGCELYLAHHANDQLETQLKRLMTGSSNFLGMRPKANYRNLRIYRPLLNTTKDELVAYANAQKLEWIEDPSNYDTSFERNFIRHKIIPELTKLWPGVSNSLATLSEKQAILLAIADEQGKLDLNNICNNNCINLVKMFELPEFRALNCWQHYLKQNDIKLDFKAQKDTLKQLKNCRAIKLGSKTLVKSGEHAYLLAIAKAKKEVYRLNEQLPIGKLVKHHNIGNLRPAKNNESISIRFRKSGQSIILANKQHSQKLKKLMQEHNIPAAIRDQWPLIYYNEECAFIPEIGTCKGFLQEHGITYNIELY